MMKVYEAINCNSARINELKSEDLKTETKTWFQHAHKRPNHSNYCFRT